MIEKQRWEILLISYVFIDSILLSKKKRKGEEKSNYYPYQIFFIKCDTFFIISNKGIFYNGLQRRFYSPSLYLRYPANFRILCKALRIMFKSNPYFSQEEFDSPDTPGSGSLMDEQFIKRLTEARKLAQLPFKITSGYRTAEHNRKIGGVENSSHVFGCACDIAVSDSISRFHILRALLMVGFTRIGIGKGFIHVDTDEDKVPEVIWDYYK